AAGNVLDSSSQKLERRFKRARPYMLAVVNAQAPSQKEDVARYLANFNIQVVDSLVVHRQVTVPPGTVLADMEAKVYLDKSVLPRIGSGGRAPRAGTLYVRKECEIGDYIAEPIAEFLDNRGLTDAFVILL